MDKLLEVVGNIVGAAGVLVCLIGGLARLSGSYYLFGAEIESIFTGGIALMVMACLAKLQKMGSV